MANHYGEIVSTNEQVVVVIRQLPDSGDGHEYGLAFRVGDIPNEYRTEITSAVNSAEGQESRNLSDFLYKKVLNSRYGILDYLHATGLLFRALTNDIVLTPAPGIKISLSDVNEAIRRELDGSAHINDSALYESKNTYKVQKEAQERSDTERLVKSLMFEANELEAQADMLRGEAKLKRDRAIQINATINPPTPTKAAPAPSVATTTAKPVKKRGRPLKAQEA